MNEKLSKRVLNSTEAAYLYGVSPGTLANWRSSKVGPPYYKLRGKVAYFVDDLEKWARQEPVRTRDSE
jgi:hypothetical protein